MYVFIRVSGCVIYLVDKVLVARVVRGDYGEDVPVILLHDVQHDLGLLLDRRTKLEKHGVVVLETRETEPISKQGHESYSMREIWKEGHKWSWSMSSNCTQHKYIPVYSWDLCIRCNFITASATIWHIFSSIYCIYDVLIWDIYFFAKSNKGCEYSNTRLRWLIHYQEAIVIAMFAHLTGKMPTGSIIIIVGCQMCGQISVKTVFSQGVRRKRQRKNRSRSFRSLMSGAMDKSRSLTHVKLPSNSSGHRSQDVLFKNVSDRRRHGRGALMRTASSHGSSVCPRVKYIVEWWVRWLEVLDHT